MLRLLRAHSEMGAAARRHHSVRFAHHHRAERFPFYIVPKGFFPQQDNGTVFGGIQGAQDISFQAMQKLTLQFVDIIKTDPAVENVGAFTGGTGAVNTGFVYLALKPLNERKISSSQMIDRLRPKLISIPGATSFCRPGRICASAADRATRNISTPFKATTWTIW